MKTTIKMFMATLFVAVLSLGFASCSGDDDDNKSNGDNNGGGNNSTELADPEGTSIGSVMYDKDIHEQYQAYGWGNFGNIDVHISNMNIDLHNGNTQIQVAGVGHVRGLAEIKSLPSSGYSTYVTPLPGYGYVGIAEGFYIRFCCIDYIRDGYGNIIGAIFKYQYPWIPGTK